MADALNQITQILDALSEDSSIPRNIRKGAADSKAKLLNNNDAMDVRAASAISILDDLLNENNMPVHARTMIYQAVSMLETIGK